MSPLTGGFICVILLLHYFGPSECVENGVYLPYGGVVKITTKFSQFTLCNGALVTYNLVLTTASCVARPLIQTSLIVRTFESSVRVNEIIYHEYFLKNFPGNGVADLALLVLATPIQDKESDIVNPLFLTRFKSHLASPGSDTKVFKRDGATYFMTGYGYSAPEEAPRDPFYISGAYLSINYDGACQNLYQHYIDNTTRLETEHFLCTYDPSPLSPAACERDQGSPLYFVKKSCAERVPLHGLVTAPFCSGMPTFYIRISYYKKWIMDNVEQFSTSGLPIQV